jgi:hypothetical protein
VQESKYARALDMLRRVENLLLDDVDIDKRVYKELRALLDDAFGYYYFQRSKYVLFVLCPAPREESGECVSGEEWMCACVAYVSHVPTCGLVPAPCVPGSVHCGAWWWIPACVCVCCRYAIGLKHVHSAMKAHASLGQWHHVRLPVLSLLVCVAPVRCVCPRL